jgi:8-oxo-dGTP pyrophosphatase MutT (NUDIX family)
MEKYAWLKTLDRRVSSACIILENEKGEALIVKANYKAHWTFPGGIVDADETPKQAAIRETYEEVGLRIDEKDVEFAWVVSRKSQQAMTHQFVFRAHLPKAYESNIVLQASEIDESVFVSRDDVYRDERNYGKVITNWAQGVSGYIEQTFGE